MRYRIGFIKSVTSAFKKKDEIQPIIPDWLFDERRKILFKLLYSPEMSMKLKSLLRKLKALLEVK